MEFMVYPHKVIFSYGFVGQWHHFENDEGATVTVNAERYRTMLTEFLWPKLDELDVNDVWFQQDGASSHTSRETIALLRSKFDDRTISRNSEVNWPPRSCDLTLLDYFLWGYLKSEVYANIPQTLQQLKNNVRTKM